MCQVQFIASKDYLSNTYNNLPSISMADDNIQDSDFCDFRVKNPGRHDVERQH